MKQISNTSDKVGIKKKRTRVIKALDLIGERDMITIISRETGLPKDYAKAFLDGFITTIMDQLISGGRVSLRNFGTFYPKQYAAKRCYNIGKRLEMKIDSRCLPVFRPAYGFEREVEKKVKPKLIK